jgi:hypothetical protein
MIAYWNRWVSHGINIFILIISIFHRDNRCRLSLLCNFLYLWFWFSFFRSLVHFLKKTEFTILLFSLWDWLKRKIMFILSSTSVSLSLFFFEVLGLELGPIPWTTPPTLFVLGIFEIGSYELFAWAGFELQSSWTLPSE